MSLTIMLNELKHNLLSMRFVVGLLFVVLVYTGSAILFTTKYLKEKDKDAENQQRMQSTLAENGKNLEDLYDNTYGLSKTQELSSFFNTGDERRFPKAFVINPCAPQGGSSQGSMIVSTSGKNYKIENYTDLDLTFIVGIVLSFLVIVLTFNAISGDREDGILKQQLSNGVRRTNILIGKYLAVLLTLLIIIVVGSLLSMIIFQIFAGQNVLFRFPGETVFSVATSMAYLSIFIFLGLWISASVSKSSTSLALLLLIWIFIVVLSPNVGGMLAQRFSPVISKTEHDAQFQAILAAHQPPSGFSDLSKGKGTEEEWKNYEHYEEQMNSSFEQLITGRFDELLKQAERAEAICFFSPYGAFRQAMEHIASTGLGYHKKFFDATRRYRTELLQFIQDRDWHDPRSKHRLASVPDVRSMSNQPVDALSIPQFTPPARIPTGEDIFKAMPSIGYLLLLNIMFFVLAGISVSRMDVR